MLDIVISGDFSIPNKTAKMLKWSREETKSERIDIICIQVDFFHLLYGVLEEDACMEITSATSAAWTTPSWSIFQFSSSQETTSMI